MSKPMTAEEFARHLRRELDDPRGTCWDDAPALIEADRLATRLALLDELIALEDASPLFLSVYEAVAELRAKYGAKP